VNLLLCTPPRARERNLLIKEIDLLKEDRSHLHKYWPSTTMQRGDNINSHCYLCCFVSELLKLHKQCCFYEYLYEQATPM
jgi:hypothetical protein